MADMSGSLTQRVSH